MNRPVIVVGIVALVAVGAAGVWTVQNRTVQGTTLGWGSGVAPAVSYTTTLTEKQPSAQELFTLFTGEHSVTLPPLSATSLLPEPETNGTYQFSHDDVVTLLQSLVPSAHTNEQVASDATLVDVYSFIPSDVFSGYTPHTNTTELQQTLFTYGNAAGAVITAHEGAWLPYQNQILQNFLDDRTNTAAIARVMDLAQGMDAAGTALEAVTPVPDSVATYHAALARGFHELAERTRDVAHAGIDDAKLLAAINASNDAADRFSTAYIGISDTLTGAHVEFNMADAGRVFIFSAQ